MEAAVQTAAVAAMHDTVMNASARGTVSGVKLPVSSSGRLPVLDPPISRDADENDGGPNLAGVTVGKDAESASTLLLRRKHNLYNVSRRLDQTRRTFAETMAGLQQVEGTFREKKNTFEQTMNEYQGVIKEADQKKTRAEQKLRQEEAAAQALVHDIGHASSQWQDGQQEVMLSQHEISKIARYAGYFEQFVAAANTGRTSDDGNDGAVTDTFNGPSEVLLRYDQLKATNQDLFEQAQASSQALEKLRGEVAALRARAQDATLLATARVQKLQQRLDAVREAADSAARAQDAAKGRTHGSRQRAGRTVTAVRNVLARVLLTLPRASLLAQMAREDLVPDDEEAEEEEEGGDGQGDGAGDETGSQADGEARRTVRPHAKAKGKGKDGAGLKEVGYTSIQPDDKGRLTIVAGPLPWAQETRAAAAEAAKDPLDELATELRRGIYVIGERLLDLQAVAEGYPTWLAAREREAQDKAQAAADDAAAVAKLAAALNPQANKGGAAGASGALGSSSSAATGNTVGRSAGQSGGATTSRPSAGAGSGGVLGAASSPAVGGAVVAGSGVRAVRARSSSLASNASAFGTLASPSKTGMVTARTAAKGVGFKNSTLGPGAGAEDELPPNVYRAAVPIPRQEQAVAGFKPRVPLGTSSANTPTMASGVGLGDTAGAGAMGSTVAGGTGRQSLGATAKAKPTGKPPLPAKR